MTPPGAPDGGFDTGRRTLIDSHVHFWDPTRLDYPWLAGLPPLDRPFTPRHLADETPEPTDVVFVEAGCATHRAADEIAWIRSEAGERPWIRGVVAHAPLEDPSEAADVVRGYADDPLVVGVRRNIQDEPAGFTRDAGFRAGVGLLGEAGLPFDACVREHQLPELIELAEACPDTVIVLDHLGKPSADNPSASWRQALRRLAEHANVVCKLSGLATEAAPGTGPEPMAAVLREALGTFGPDRCLYGSDWPVMILATGYGTWLDLVCTALVPFGDAAADAVLHGNASRVYRLDRADASTGGRARKEPA
ncbi:metal-dependent hydrolase [Streptomyces sulfonofaciens]|uniref:Metal-dependent hydrolase n=1 Tax=Streptomyces sulfonofaciens TaxID=68272 RepID=A0A919FUC7_9ACTN|nr:amidohydrolase family protein [Streptomyces sulfonofaciens]GHH71670.1 metal-dependent hydrolase [Streptomyces sulfonofaciens]